MHIIRTSPLITSSSATALTIGNFDGVHLGHAAILNELVMTAKAMHLVPTVVTFEPHPKAFFAAHFGRGAAPEAILPLRNKVGLLAACGVEQVVILPFDDSLASMSATDFVADLLVHTLKMKHLLIGDDFRFGARRAGDFELLQRMSATHGYSLAAHDSVRLSNVRISSSSIRDMLRVGDLTGAEDLLGRKLVLSGHIIYGRQLGRTIDCPTINIKMPAHLASQGIYAVMVEVNGHMHQGVASIGLRPSVVSNGECWLEVHILDFDQNVYGQLAHVTLLHKIRDELKFNGLDELKNAIAQDISDARGFFARS